MQQALICEFEIFVLNRDQNACLVTHTCHPSIWDFEFETSLKDKAGPCHKTKLKTKQCQKIP